MATQSEAERQVWLGLWIHLAVYIAVTVGLGILNFSRNPDKLWFLWVVGGWGIGIVLHGLNVLIPACRQKLVESRADRLERRHGRTA